MNLRVSGVLAIAAFALAGVLGTAQCLAQNAYITNSDGTAPMIDTVTNTVVATIPVSGGAVAVSTDGSRVYFANGSYNTVSVIDTASNTVIATIPINNPSLYSAYGVAVTPDDSKVYVANNTGYTISVIQTSTDTVIATIPNLFTPLGVAITRDSSKVYVGGYSGVINKPGVVWVIDAASNTIIATIDNVGIDPVGVAVTPDGSKVYVAGNYSNTVSVIDTSINKVTATIPASGPWGVAVTPDGSKVYVANSNANDVLAIATADNSILATIPVGRAPGAFGIFIQPPKPAPPPPKFAGTPGYTNCHGQSVSALARQYGGLTAAAAVLRFSSVRALQNAILAYCGG